MQLEVVGEAIVLHIVVAIREGGEEVKVLVHVVRVSSLFAVMMN